MFLKSMDMFGFKSFAEKTHVDFEPGITAIVGPNGCGKSNVVDAVKWVLGEKQAKNIRGQTMEDIIFSGTDQRKALSLAEVSLTIDNTNRILDFDSEMVTVSRRIFRDGESEYLISETDYVDQRGFLRGFPGGRAAGYRPGPRKTGRNIPDCF